MLMFSLLLRMLQMSSAAALPVVETQLVDGPRCPCRAAQGERDELLRRIEGLEAERSALQVRIGNQHC